MSGGLPLYRPPQQQEEVDDELHQSRYRFEYVDNEVVTSAHRRIHEELENAVERLQISCCGGSDVTASTAGSNLTSSLSMSQSGLGASPTSPSPASSATPPPGSFTMDMSFLNNQQVPSHRLHQRHQPHAVVADLESGLLHQPIAPHHPQDPSVADEPVIAAAALAPVAAAGPGGEPNRGNDGADATGGRDGEEGDSIAGMFRQLIGQNPELRGTVAALEKYVPFIIMLAFKLLFDHGTGIIVSACLVTTFFHANSVVRQQVGRQDRRNAWALLAVLVNLVACVVFIYFVFQDEKLYNCAIFLPPAHVDSLYELIWLVGVNDFILKFVAVIFKIVLIFFPARVVPYQKRGKFFLFIERASQLHRELAPIQVWLVYLLNGYEKIPGKVLGVILVAAYMVNKGKFLLRSAKAMKVAVEKLMQSTNYGKSPSSEQLKANGNSCPICYDNFRTPVMLHCKHIFCEECLSTWFDRERTCPLCRAHVTEDPQWRDGSTSQFVQLF